MARKLPPIDFDKARRLRAEGQSINKIAAALDISVMTLWSRHVAGLIDLGPRISGARIVPAKKRGKLLLSGAELVTAHEAGESILQLATRCGVSRGMICTAVRCAGGTIRGRQAANTLVAQNKTPEQRKAGAEAAHKARSLTPVKLEEKLLRASRRSTMVGCGELNVADALRGRGYAVEQQWPCGKYNIDVAFGPIAVELMSSATNPCADPVFVQRTEDLRNAGYCTIVVRFRCRFPDDIPGNLDDIVTFLERTYRNPALRRQNWVIRCCSERFARIRNHLGQFAVIPAPIRYFHTVSEWNP